MRLETVSQGANGVVEDPALAEKRKQREEKRRLLKEQREQKEALDRIVKMMSHDKEKKAARLLISKLRAKVNARKERTEEVKREETWLRRQPTHAKLMDMEA